MSFAFPHLLQYRKKFNFTDEEELINWYNHLRYGISIETSKQTKKKTLSSPLCRSYTALADVVSLFVVLPLMVRTLGFHDMTIVICAVSAHVRQIF